MAFYIKKKRSSFCEKKIVLLCIMINNIKWLRSDYWQIISKYIKLNSKSLYGNFIF